MVTVCRSQCHISAGHTVYSSIYLHSMFQGQNVSAGPSPPDLLSKQISLVLPVVYDGVAFGGDYGKPSQDAKYSYQQVIWWACTYACLVTWPYELQTCHCHWRALHYHPHPPPSLLPRPHDHPHHHSLLLLFLLLLRWLPHSSLLYGNDMANYVDQITWSPTGFTCERTPTPWCSGCCNRKELSRITDDGDDKDCEFGVASESSSSCKSVLPPG